MTEEAIARLRAALEAGPTPGPWTHGEYKGYCVDWVRTEHPDYQGEPCGAYVCETGNAAGNNDAADKAWPRNAAFIAAANPEAIRLLLAKLDSHDAALNAAYAEGRRDGREEAEPLRKAIVRAEQIHTGMSYGDEKHGSISEYTRGWGDCLRGIKQAMKPQGSE